MKIKLPSATFYQKVFFYGWMLCLLVFSGLVIVEQKKPVIDGFITDLLIGSVLAGILLFVLTWGFEFILFLRKKVHQPFARFSILVTLVWALGLGGYLYLNKPELPVNTQAAQIQSFAPSPSPSPSPKPTTKPKVADSTVSNSGSDAEWGKATKNPDGSYTMKIKMDDRMSTAPELFEAINNYRNTKGKSSLAWDDRLAGYAQERANYICTNGGDGHAGFYKFLEEGGYDKLGFNGLGENQGRMKLIGVHLVEWMYAQSPGHEKNQLGPWSHMGVGISEYCSVVIFGGGKM